MITKSICLTVCIMLSFGAYSQSRLQDTLTRSSTRPGVSDSMQAKQTAIINGKTVSDTATANKNSYNRKSDTLAPKTGLNKNSNTDSLRRQSATVNRKTDSLVKKPTTVSAPVKAKSEEKKPATRTYDPRWYISPLLKFQVQEFGMLEKQRKNYLSDAQNLSLKDKSNIAFGASIYKNLSNHLAISADVGFSRGHVTNNDSLISGAKTKSYNLVNATLYYHLLGGQYRLQPFVAAGINNLTNDASYTSAPVGLGVKYTSKYIMVETQAAYGYSVSKNISSTLMYSLGVYIPFRSKKAKQRELEAAEQEEKRRDSSKGDITNITNNYYPCNPDSIKKMLENTLRKKIEDSVRKSILDSMDKARVKDQAGKKPKTQKIIGSSGNKDDVEEIPLEADDPMLLPAAVKEVVYFYYDQYALTSSAFSTVDEVITKMKSKDNLYVHLKGYTDLSGSENYNAPLSRKRAQMVFDYMNSRGINSEKIIVSSYGKNNPVVNSTDPNSAWKNRRCEIVLYEKE